MTFSDRLLFILQTKSKQDVQNEKGGGAQTYAGEWKNFLTNSISTVKGEKQLVLWLQIINRVTCITDNDKI